MNLQIIISGIGGQGVLFATKVLSQTALSKGFKMIGSETHGMAQRGGSVTSHLKIGDFLNPLIRTGTADIIYAFDETEFLRALPFIKEDGVCFVNSNAGDFLCTKIRQHLTKNNIEVSHLDADKIALKLGMPLSVNLVLLGFSIASNRLPFSLTEMEQTIKKITPGRFLEMNFKAFRSGVASWKG